MRVPIYYTFGNHMHWVDMEWLWGYHVLPGSVRDMLHYCKKTGAKGNVNFDGVGYEKLAAEDPEALMALREAVLDGTIEPVGCSYGQPYGLFHGGESNVRQRVYGARAVRRLLGVWPKTFWEEEFDFFPQLPQMLKGCGFKFASLFFQWTWHTPETPIEDVPVIWWEGLDGSRLLCATRNKLNLHQWPEDVDAMLADLEGVAADESPQLILQWLELMPSPDWMCRSEVLLPRMKALLADERFDVRFGTLSECIVGLLPTSTLGMYGDFRVEENQDARGTRRLEADATLLTKQYTMDDVWHGLTLGKNGDSMRRASINTERLLQSAEAALSVASLLGRPYPQWDVYPVWELEEAWRKLLRSQHHDNDECEGLCGHVANWDYEWLYNCAYALQDRFQEFCQRFGTVNGRFNPNGWEVEEVPAFGFRAGEAREAETEWTISGSIASHQSGDLLVKVDINRATLQIITKDFPDGVFQGEMLLLPVSDHLVQVTEIEVKVNASSVVCSAYVNGQSFVLSLNILPGKGVEIYTSQKSSTDAPGGYRGSDRLYLPLNLKSPIIKTETPYGVVEVEGRMKGMRKYPEGDWMTSPQWFEQVENGFYGLSFVDFSDKDRGVLVLQDSTTQWFRRDEGFECVVAAYDPWDEKNIPFQMDKSLQIIAHRGLSRADAWKRANSKALIAVEGLPKEYSAFACDSPNVVITALYREAEDFSGKHLDDYAGQGMGYPFVIRLVEFEGKSGFAEILIASEVSKAFTTNLLGQVENELAVEQAEHNEVRHPLTGTTSLLHVPVGANQIITLYLDIVEGRKQARDLDAKREIWASVHRQG